MAVTFSTNSIHIILYNEISIDILNMVRGAICFPVEIHKVRLLFLPLCFFDAKCPFSAYIIIYIWAFVVLG